MFLMPKIVLSVINYCKKKCWKVKFSKCADRILGVRDQNCKDPQGKEFFTVGSDPVTTATRSESGNCVGGHGNNFTMVYIHSCMQNLLTSYNLFLTKKVVVQKNFGAKQVRYRRGPKNDTCMNQVVGIRFNTCAKIKAFSPLTIQ